MTYLEFNFRKLQNPPTLGLQNLSSSGYLYAIMR